MATSPEGFDTASDAVERRVSPAQAGLLIGGLLVLLVLVWFLFLRSDDEAESPAVAPAPVTEEAPEEEAAEPPTKRDPVETFEVFAPKDPFDPLISASTGSDGGAATGPGDVGATTVTTGSDGATTTTVTTGGSGTGGTDAGEDVGGHRVRVIDVFRDENGRRAQVQVDGTVYTVDEGETFAANFQLLSASARCATMLFGDDEFTLCEGEEILK